MLAISEGMDEGRVTKAVGDGGGGEDAGSVTTGEK